eukprot:6472734-Amphidinium_carterae.1
MRLLGSSRDATLSAISRHVACGESVTCAPTTVHEIVFCPREQRSTAIALPACRVRTLHLCCSKKELRITTMIPPQALGLTGSAEENV